MFRSKIRIFLVFLGLSCSANYVKALEINDLNLDTLFCDQTNNSVKFTSQVLNLPVGDSCIKPSLPSNNGAIKVSNLDDVVYLTKKSPSIKALDFSYLSTKLTEKASYLTAFGPQLKLSSGSLSVSNTTTNYNYNNQTRDGRPSNSPASTQDSTYTQSASITPLLSIPIFNPQNINLARYYSNLSKSSAYSTTDNDLTQISSALTNFLNLWIQSRQLQVSVDNLEASLQALAASVGQYKVGLLAKPDLGSTYSTYKSYQTSLLDSINSYNTSYNSLANSLGVQPDNIQLTPSALSDDALFSITNYVVPSKDKLRSLVLENSSQLYADIYQSRASDRFADYYLSTYLPTFSILASFSPSSSYSSFKSSQSGSVTEQYDYTSSSPSSYAVGLSFNWTLFDSLSAAASASSQKKLSLSYIEQARALAISKIQSALSSISTYESYTTSTVILLKSTQASLNAYNGTLYALRAGFSDTTTLVQRLNQLNSNRTSYLTSLQTALAAKINIAYLTRSGIYLNYNPYNLIYSSQFLDILK
jgi:outer membrane protein TolC